MKKRGFTLIELLVVIAIIGILATIVLVSLNTARNKAKDAAIKSELEQTRIQAEIIWDSDHNYDGVCAGTGSLSDADTSLLKLEQGIIDQNGSTVTCASPTSPAQSYIVHTPLVAGAPDLWCVDNTGDSLQITGTPGAGDYTCR